MKKNPEKLKPKTILNSRNKNAAIEIYVSSLEEKQMETEMLRDKMNNLTSKEQTTLYDLKNDKGFINKSTDKGSAVVVWDRNDYIKEE